MYIHYYDNQIRIEWTIYRGLTKTTEDFRRATLVCMLVTEGNRFPVVPEVVSDDNSAYLSIVVPAGLPEGVYDIMAVWTKNGGRSVSQSCRQQVFSVTADQEEATDHGGASLETALKFSSSAGTYGYDGLSAYELALLKGLTTKDETAWVREQIDTAVERIDSARDDGVAAVESAKTDALSAINTKVGQGLDSIDAGIDEASTAIQSMQNEAVRAGKSLIDDERDGALTEIGDTKGFALEAITNAKGYAIDDVNETKDAAVSAVGTAKADALSAIGDAVANINVTYDEL